MFVLLFGVSNVGKTTVGKMLGKRLNIPFFDIDDEIKKYYAITLEEFVHIGTIIERDEKRGKLIGKILESEQQGVIAVSPMSYPEYFLRYLNQKEIVAIELTDSAENIFERLIFSDEEDNLYEDLEYKNLHKDYFMKDIEEDLAWYGQVYQKIKNKYNISNQSPEEVADKIIQLYIGA